MISASIVFLSTFLTVFALGLQSLNVNQGHYVAAVITSFAISTGHLWLYKVMPNPTWLDLGGYYLGGIVGITASMWFHRVVKTWWKARREKAAVQQAKKFFSHRHGYRLPFGHRDDTH